MDRKKSNKNKVGVVGPSSAGGRSVEESAVQEFK